MRHQMILFFFQAEDGIRDYKVTGVQTCALPILILAVAVIFGRDGSGKPTEKQTGGPVPPGAASFEEVLNNEIGRASCRERGEISVVAGSFKKKNTNRSGREFEW